MISNCQWGEKHPGRKSFVFSPMKADAVDGGSKPSENPSTKRTKNYLAMHKCEVTVLGS
jgi:hypothetical protein